MEGKEPLGVITLSGMLSFFKDDQNIIEKGEQKFKSGFALEVQMRDHMINGKIRVSIKDKCYAVWLKVNGDGNILTGPCECPRGNWFCSHVAATAIYANIRGLSKTDLAAKQDRKTMKDFFPCSRPDYKAIPTLSV